MSKSYWGRSLHIRQRNGDNGTWSNWLRLLDESDLTWDNIAGKPSSFTPSAHTHSWTSITDKIVAGNEFNIVNAGFNNIMWFNYLPINDRNKTATINSYYFGNGHQGLASVTASGFVKNGSSDSYVLLGGGGHKAFGGDNSNPIFLGYLNLEHGNDGTISSSFYCLGYSVPFTYTRGGNYCRIYIPDTTHQTFYIRAAIASVNYSGGGMDTWVGDHRGDGAWWLHCYASGLNEVRVKGFC